MTDVPAASPSTQKPFQNFSLKTFLGWLHLWTGIIFCIPFVALGISGSLLMIDHELPNRFVENPAAMNFKPVAEIVAAAAAVAPQGFVATGYDVPAKAGDSAVVRFTQPRREGGPREGAPGNQAGPQAGSQQAGSQQAGPQQASRPQGAPPQAGPRGGPRVLVDPMTLEAKLDPQQRAGGAREFNFMRLMHDMHGRMLIEGALGRQFVGWLGVFMCGLGLSGIYMWWPRPGQWKAAFKVRFGQSALRINRELHGAVGIWGLIIFMIVSFSGVYIAFPQAINGAVGASPAIRDLRNQQQFPVVPSEETEALNADGAIELAKSAVEGGVVRSVMLPASPTQPYRVMMSRVGEYNGTPRATVIVDQWRKEIIEVRDPAQYTTTNKFLAWQRQMHAGNGLGILWWLAVFISGFLPPLFVGTGITMWLLKRRNKRRVAAQA